VAMDLKMDQLQAGLERFGKLPKAYRLAVYPVLVGLVLGLYGYLLFMPAQKQLAKARTKQFELQRKLNEVRSVAANMDKFEAEIAELEKRFKIALRQLPDSKELPVLLTDVTSLGKNAGLEFRAFRPQAEVKRDFYAEVPIEVEFTGHYHDIAQFFDRVAKLPRIVNVAQLTMEIGSESALDTTLEVKGRATTFRFLEAPPPKPEATKNKARRKGRKAGRAKKAGGEA
jgi:type IV pilus assembly protein PilO